MRLACVVVAQSDSFVGGDLPFLLLMTALMLWLGGEAFLVWYRYGRLPIDERYKHVHKFKSDIFVKVPGLYLLFLSISGLCFVVMWVAFFVS